MKQITNTLLALVTLLLCGISLSAQNPDERMVVQTKNGQKIGFRLNDIAQMGFLESKLDLAATLKGTPLTNEAGSVSLAITAGKDVALVKMFFLESFMVPNDITDEKIMELMKSLKNVFTVGKMGEWNLNWDLKGMQHGYKYKGFIIAYDDTGIYGPVGRASFELPRLPLQGNPQVDVKFSDVKYSTLTAKVTPNTDVQGYFFLLDTKDGTQREQMMKMMGVPDLQHYIIRFGGKAGKPHTASNTIHYKELLPGTEYQIFAVMADAQGQYSEPLTYDVATLKKGTSETSKIAVTVSGVTANEAKVSCVPNEATQWYRYLIVEQSAYNEEQIKKLILEQPVSPQYPKDVEPASFTWSNLKPNTAYFAVAMGVNGDNKAGEITKIAFNSLQSKTARSAKGENAIPQREGKGENAHPLHMLPGGVKAAPQSAEEEISLLPAKR